MGILQKKLPTHWNYFLAIERDVERLSRYVEFTTENLAAYSLEMARIILASASEADVLLKGICQEHSPDSGAASINAYRDVIKEAFPKFSRFNVRLSRWEISLAPWSSWDDGEVPGWWTACNKVKHARDEHFHRANLLHTLDAAAGLFVANLYYHYESAEAGRLLPTSAIFRAAEEHISGTTFHDVEFGVNYKLA